MAPTDFIAYWVFVLWGQDRWIRKDTYTDSLASRSRENKIYITQLELCIQMKADSLAQEVFNFLNN